MLPTHVAVNDREARVDYQCITFPVSGSTNITPI